jgi:hypothetical protein
MFFSVLQIISSLLVAFAPTCTSCCWGVCCWGWPSAVSGRCRPPRQCVWCLPIKCRKRWR